MTTRALWSASCSNCTIGGYSRQFLQRNRQFRYDEHNSYQDDNGKNQMAFKLSGDAYWMCSDSGSASSLVLSAREAEKDSITMGALSHASHSGIG
ncbi:hypothetical protein F0267_23160 [Vibrio coralliilyticus]|uniref:Uncharacterized protein n=1 Tax=Vibrio coralliilyticus TaxID=190893 RepID=A0AAN0SBI1_9VIBR|nr:hypothetical protein [Vibrio coralliilyticus]AIW18805.1 hypothetical protein IX92_06990 [Vibrio coralliilyticus]NOH41130.1 hypothetical protein [Vibrio coralliilyticus]